MTKQPDNFSSMPTDYAGLCGVFLPRPIHNRVSYENTVEIADVFAGFEDRMSDDQNDYFDLLCDLIEKREKERARLPKLQSLALLKQLAQEHGLTGAALSRILGKSPSLGPMILRGERKITARSRARPRQAFRPSARRFPVLNLDVYIAKPPG